MRRLIPGLFAIAFAGLCSFQGMATESDGIIIGNLENIMTTRVYGHLSVDADGNVVHYEIRTPLSPDLKSLVDSTVQAWKFRPVLIGDKPSSSEADVQITLVGRHDGEDLLVKVDSAIFSRLSLPDAPAHPVTITPRGAFRTSYPPELLSAGVEAVVVVALRLTPQGEVKDAFPVQVSLLDVHGKPDTLEAAARLAAVSAAAQARRFRFNVVSHVVNLPADALMVNVPMVFVIDDRTNAGPGQWRTEIRSRRHWPSWEASQDQNGSWGSSDWTFFGWDNHGDRDALELATKVDGSAL